MPTVAGFRTEPRLSEASFSASVVLRTADPVQAVQQVWDIVPRMGGVLLQSQGMVTSARRASRGSVEVTLSVTAERYQALIEALRQLSGAQVIEEGMPSASREQRPASSGFPWRLDYAQTSMTPQTTLVITVQPR
jgi:hypothetical protein